MSPDPARLIIWALLIGIDDYEPGRLYGSVNDVLAMQELLVSHYGVSSDRILLLVNERATRANIIAAFHSFLIDNPAICRGDQILFHFSGHGSQLIAGPDSGEPDNLYEAIVPYDGRARGAWGIPDRTLALLLSQLAAAKSTSAGDNITVIIDSCHSASSTRDIPRAVRRLAPNTLRPPADLDADLFTSERASDAPARHVLLAAARSNEPAFEFQPPGEGAPSYHGVFTYELLAALRRLPGSATYADLHRRVATHVSIRYPEQHPQCDGDRDRLIFSGARTARAAAIPVQSVSADGKTLVLAAGSALGLRVGTELTISERRDDGAGTMREITVASATISAVGGTTITATINDLSTEPPRPGMSARVSKLVYGGLRTGVAISAAADSASQLAVAVMRQVLVSEGSSNAQAYDAVDGSYLQLLDGADEYATLQVRAEDGSFRIYDDKARLLVAPFSFAADRLVAPRKASADAARRVRAALESIARWRAIIELRNEDEIPADLNGAISIGLRRYLRGAGGVTLQELDDDAEDDPGITITIDPHDESANRYVIDIFNGSARDIYPHVFMLKPDYSIRRIYPNNDAKPLKPSFGDEGLVIGRNVWNEPVFFDLPTGQDKAVAWIKLIVTTAPVDLEILQQESLQVPSAATQRTGAVTPLLLLIEAVAGGSGFRAAAGDSSVADWITLEFPVNVVAVR